MVRLASSYLIGFGVLEVRIDKVITPSVRRIQNGRTPLPATVPDPVLKLLGDIAQAVASNPLTLPIGIEEADHSLGLLKRLNQSVQKNPIKTTVAKINAILVVFAEDVHCWLLCGETPGTYRGECLCDIEHRQV